MDEATSRRALVVSPLLPAPAESGGKKRTLRLLETMEAAGATPHLITTDDRADAATELRARGWAVDVVPAPRQSLRGRAVQHARRLPSPYLAGVAARLAALAAEGCAFAQFEHTQSAYYFDHVAGAAVVLSLHNVDSEMLRTIWRDERRFTAGWVRGWSRWHAMRRVERRMLPRADAVLCVSSEDARLLEPHARTVVVPNGVDPELFEVDGVAPPGERVLFFGRLDYPPNAHGLERALLEVWPRIASARPDAKFAVAGAGMPHRLARLAARERVEVLGFVPDLPTELARARVVLVPVWQGGGTRLKVLEALAAARPVVGTRLGVSGIGFEDGRHGLTADHPEVLAELATTLLSDGERSRRLGAEGRRLAERYRWDRVLAPAEALYSDWLRKRGRYGGV
jgi:glycosyltransferase involved in cell wall biosynthesis